MHQPGTKVRLLRTTDANERAILAEGVVQGAGTAYRGGEQHFYYIVQLTNAFTDPFGGTIEYIVVHPDNLEDMS